MRVQCRPSTFRTRSLALAVPVSIPTSCRVMLTPSLYERREGRGNTMTGDHDHERTISRIRKIVDHPIVDADAHLVEPFHLILEELREILGPNALAEFERSRYHTLYSSTAAWPPMTAEQRQREWAVAPVWWGTPIHATDRVAAYVPEALYGRLERLGIDHALVYPSWLGMPRIPEADLRVACCRAVNQYLARATSEYRDRITPVAMIPTVTPQ
jgi:hypothetical protein